MKKSRRQFLKLVAAGSAAALTGTAGHSVAAAAVKATSRAAAGAPATTPTGAVRAEVNRQKAQTAKSLQTLRDYPLPAGSPMAFAFKPLRPGRGRKAR